MTFYLPAVIAVPASHDLGRTTFVLPGACIMSLLIAGFCAPGVGKWIDGHDGKRSIAASVCVLALGKAKVALSPNLEFWHLG
jgi:hypothetical protein